MIFWLFVIILSIGILMIILENAIKTYSCIDAVGFAAVVFSGLVLTVMITVITAQCVVASGTKASLEEQYKALEYKAKTEACRDELGLMNKEFLDEVQEWNMDVVKYKKYQRDFWIGIFYPNIFDEFETIDLERMVFKEVLP